MELTKKELQALAITELAIKRTIDGRGKPEEAVKENYINKTAAEALLFLGLDPMTSYGKPVSKVYQEYYNVEKAVGDFSSYYQHLTNWNRNDLITGSRAKEYWDLVFDYSSEFMKRITIKSGDELTYPLDIYASIEENFIDSLAVGSQPTGAQLKDQGGVIGKELFARRMENQFNLPELDIINNLYNTKFEDEITARRLIGINNDLLRVWTNGTSDDYTSVTWATFTHNDMYRLGIGWLKNLQDGNGSWTNSNANAIVIGALGDRVTANKIEITGIGWITDYTSDWSSVVDGWLGVTSTLSIASGLKIANAGYARKDGIAVTPNSKCKFVFTEIGEDGSSSVYGAVLGADGTTVLGSSTAITGTGTSHTVEFFSGNNNFVQLRIYQAAAKYTTVTTATAIVTEYKVTRTGDDIIDYMDTMIKNQPSKYKDPSKTVFIMGLTDVESYADAKGEAVKVVGGMAIGVNTTVKDQWRVNGDIPRHKGYEVIYNPMMDSISEYKTYGGSALAGSILFCDPKDLWAYVLDKIRKHREEKARATTGGSGIEFTDVIFSDAQTAPNERIGIAYYGAVVESIILMQTVALKSTVCVSTTTTSAAGLVPYCDTKGARMFMTLTSNVADLGTLALALAGVTAGDVWEIKTGVLEGTALGQSVLTAAAHSFRAFKTIDGVEVLGKSAVTACTFA